MARYKTVKPKYRPKGKTQWMIDTLRYAPRAVSGAVQVYNRQPKKPRRPSYTTTTTGKKRKFQTGFKSGSNCQGPCYVKRGRPLKTGRKKKAPKVTMAFKQKVEKATEGPKYHGRYETKGHYLLHNPTVNTILWYDAHGGTAQGPLVMNSPLQVEDAAAVLWHQKAAAYDWATTTATNFPLNELKFRVGRVDVQYILTNNTQRNQFVHIYECIPKTDTNTLEPLEDWKNILTSEVTTAAAPEPNIQTQSLTETTLTDGYTSNWGPRPEYHKGWRHRWKHSITKMEIPPGGSYVYNRKAGTYHFDGTTVGLPSGGAAATNQTYKRGMTHAFFFMIRPELSYSYTAAGTPHFGYFISNAGAGSIPTAPNSDCQVRLETRYRYFLTMPDITFPIDNAVAGTAQLAGSNRHDSYAYFAPFDLVQTDANTRIDDRDPGVMEGLDLAAELLHNL